jgi:hypothetical protein
MILHMIQHVCHIRDQYLGHSQTDPLVEQSSGTTLLDELLSAVKEASPMLTEYTHITQVIQQCHNSHTPLILHTSSHSPSMSRCS